MSSFLEVEQLEHLTMCWSCCGHCFIRNGSNDIYFFLLGDTSSSEPVWWRTLQSTNKLRRSLCHSSRNRKCTQFSNWSCLICILSGAFEQHMKEVKITSSSKFRAGWWNAWNLSFVVQWGWHRSGVIWRLLDQSLAPPQSLLKWLNVFICSSDAVLSGIETCLQGFASIQRHWSWRSSISSQHPTTVAHSTGSFAVTLRALHRYSTSLSMIPYASLVDMQLHSDLVLTFVWGGQLYAVSLHLALECIYTWVWSNHLSSDLISPLLQINMYIIDICRDQMYCL